MWFYFCTIFFTPFIWQNRIELSWTFIGEIDKLGNRLKEFHLNVKQIIVHSSFHLYAVSVMLTRSIFEHIENLKEKTNANRVSFFQWARTQLCIWSFTFNWLEKWKVALRDKHKHRQKHWKFIAIAVREIGPWLLYNADTQSACRCLS